MSVYENIHYITPYQCLTCSARSIEENKLNKLTQTNQKEVVIVGRLGLGRSGVRRGWFIVRTSYTSHYNCHSVGILQALDIGTYGV